LCRVTATSDIFALSLHDALPICGKGIRSMITSWHAEPGTSTPCHSDIVPNRHVVASAANCRTRVGVWSSPWHSTVMSVSPSRVRSEEHTSELQSREDLVCRLLLE